MCKKEAKKLASAITMFNLIIMIYIDALFLINNLLYTS